MRLVLCSLVVLAWTSGPLFGPKTPTLPLAPASAAETKAPAVDFDQLHAQARDALARLRQTQAARRMTVASAD